MKTLLAFLSIPAGLILGYYMVLAHIALTPEKPVVTLADYLKVCNYYDNLSINTQEKTKECIPSEYYVYLQEMKCKLQSDTMLNPKIK